MRQCIASYPSDHTKDQAAALALSGDLPEGLTNRSIRDEDAPEGLWQMYSSHVTWQTRGRSGLSIGKLTHYLKSDAIGQATARIAPGTRSSHTAHRPVSWL